jgi:hypothetical protein
MAPKYGAPGSIILALFETSNGLPAFTAKYGFDSIIRGLFDPSYPSETPPLPIIALQIIQSQKKKKKEKIPPSLNPIFIKNNPNK